MPGTLLIGFRTASGGYTVVSAANPLPVTGGGGGGGGGDVNLTGLNGVAPAVGAGNSGTDTQRVVIATNQAPIAAKIDQTTPGTTNGVVLKNTAGAEVILADATTGAVTAVAATTSVGTLLAANTSRKMASFFNNSGQTLYLHCSATGTPSASLFTIKVVDQGYVQIEGYNGIVRGLLAAGSGNVMATEFA